MKNKKKYGIYNYNNKYEFSIYDGSQIIYVQKVLYLFPLKSNGCRKSNDESRKKNTREGVFRR